MPLMKRDERRSIPLPDIMLSENVRVSLKFKSMLCYESQLKKDLRDY